MNTMERVGRFLDYNSPATQRQIGGQLGLSDSQVANAINTLMNRKAIRSKKFVAEGCMRCLYSSLTAKEPVSRTLIESALASRTELERAWSI